MPSSSLLDPIIYSWLGAIVASPPIDTAALRKSPLCNDCAAPRPIKRPHSTDMDSGVGVAGDDQETPRPAKRLREINDPFYFSPTSSSRSDSTASVTSHKSGRLSPTKQIHALRDLERPVIFCDFNSVEADSGRSDVAAMRTAVQMLADGVGIVDYDNADAFGASLAQLSELDRARLLRPWARDASRALRGVTPAIHKIANIVDDAIVLNTGAGGAEDEWNSDVQKPLLKLALATSQHTNVLSLHSV
ncbi:hypothetical protein E8E11_004165 [Didymella keratinophila]|nr:hypothetical protein E8E11_004165 [Didymella keratinophila]